jgi:hypothetical protein
MSEYRTTIGTIGADRKVHLAHGVDAQHILCRHGAARRATTTTLAEVGEHADTCDVLLGAEITISNLCAHCFSIKLRVRYKAAIQAAIAALTD